MYVHSGEISTCSAPQIDHAVLDPSSETYQHNQTVTVSCETGYTLSGLSVITCSDTTFVETLPSCELCILYYY